MHTVAGSFTTRAEARDALCDLEKQGIAPVSENIIEANDLKGFEREHRPMRPQVLRGAVAGAVFGMAFFGILVSITGGNLWALYLGGFAACIAAGAAVCALWNMGVSHDEALLYEEAQKTGAVIAAVEVDDPIEAQVIHALEKHGARDVRSGDWQPLGWKHVHPAYSVWSGNW